MIPTKARENRRVKAPKFSKNLERLCKEAKCRDCTVVVTRMDFAKILGKFNKVKIQYESSSTPQTKRSLEASPRSRLSKENGMVQVLRKAYNPHPARKLLGLGKKSKNNDNSNLRQTPNVLKDNNTKAKKTENNTKTMIKKPENNTKTLENNTKTLVKKSENITKIMLGKPEVNTKAAARKPENNMKTAARKPENNMKVVSRKPETNMKIMVKNPEITIRKVKNTKPPPSVTKNNGNVFESCSNKIYEIVSHKNYRIVFENPTDKNMEIKSKVSLDNLLPDINKSVLPTEDWCIDYFPKRGEPKDDKIYDRIAAELEDLMYNEKTKNVTDNKESKVDEFPSILDILNDNSKDKNEQSSSVNLESSDVEAMLLGKLKSPEPMAMEIDNPDVPSLITGPTGLSNVQGTNNSEENPPESSTIDDNPESPSILDENLTSVAAPPTEEKALITADSQNPTSGADSTTKNAPQLMETDVNENTNSNNRNDTIKTGVTQVIFKKTTNGTSCKSVTCPKNLMYSISIQGKSVELLGAPKFISSLEDLQVLLQIVEESELSSLYMCH